MKRKLALFAATFAVLAAFAAAGPITLDVQEHVLGNGMKILMIPKPGVPRVVCHIYFKAGSINEWPGITGSAHFHEHLMFKGTKIMGVTDYAKESEIDRQIEALMDKVYKERFWKPGGGDPALLAEWQKEYERLVEEQKAYIVKDDLWTQYMKNGGTGLNASTGQETTGYYVTLPSNKIELQMLLESDRLRSAVFREFYSEKDVIMEERRLSENSPGFFFSEQVQAAFFAASPYRWGVIGWMDDLRKVTRKDLYEFHNRFYVPNNAVAIYVGDFDPKALTALAEKYFGDIPRGPELEPVRTSEPPQYSEKRMSGEGPSATNLRIMFHIPPEGDPDASPLQVLAATLSGETGILYKDLVKGKEMAVNASAFARPQWYVGAFQFSATPRMDRNVQPEDLEKEIWARIDKVKTAGVPEEDIQKAKNQREAAFIRSLASSAGLASSVGRAELHRGWRSILTDLEEFKKVTNDDIRRVAAKYFVKDNSLTAIYRRKMGR